MANSLQAIREHLNKQNLAAYIRLDGRSHGSYEYSDLLVNMLTGYHGRDWEQSHKDLHEDDSLMINPRQFWDFRNLINSGKAYDGNGKKVPTKVLRAIEDEIFGIRTPRRAEWLNAKFTLVDRRMHINYGYRVIDGKLKPLVSEPLEDCLMQEGYIDLKKINRHGMPVKSSAGKSVYYFIPADGTVAWFDANSDWAYLGCDWDPQYSNSDLGVRQAKIFRGKQ